MWSESDGERELQEYEAGLGRSSAGSEVVMMAERTIASTSRNIPTVANLNVSRFSKLHIGNRFVTQNIHNNEVIKGRMLGLELVSPTNSRRMRCSIAVFVCWAFVVAFALAFYFFYFAFAKYQVRLDTGLNQTWFLRRADWQSMPEYTMDFLNLPVKYVLVGHSGTHYCKEKSACIKEVLAIQQDHLRRGWDDIGPNYLISGNGLVFEGRGANVWSAMVQSYNRKCISVMFLGHYGRDPVVEEQFDHFKILLDKLLALGVLVPNYTIYGHCQVSTFIVSPGRHIIDGLRNFTHWDSYNEGLCITD